MRLRWSRFTVRTLLVLVAVAAVVMTTAWPALERRWKACQVVAARNRGLAEMQSAAATTLEHAKMWKEADSLRQSEAIHRGRARSMAWAFLDPTRTCVLDDDLY